MPARLIYAIGQYYHLYNRGRSRLSICHNPEDFLKILSLLKEYSHKYQITIIAYCLLPNHYHILVRQDNTPRASLLPQRVFNSYSKSYNLKYNHSGTIFQGVAQVRPVQDEVYLLHLCRYIHANPIVHGLIQTIDDWHYSNYPEWVETRSGSLVDRAFVQAHFSTPTQYREFVLDYLISRHHPDGLNYLEEW